MEETELIRADKFLKKISLLNLKQHETAKKSRATITTCARFSLFACFALYLYSFQIELETGHSENLRKGKKTKE